MRRMGPTKLLLSSAIFALCAQQGCRPLPRDLFGDGSEIVPLPPDHVITADELMPLKPARGRVEITLQRLDRRTAAFTMEPKPDHWRYAIEGLRIVRFRRTDDGAIVTASTDELSENVAVEFDPPLVELPAELVMGRPMQYESRMRVMSLGSGVERDQGLCTYQIELLGKGQVSTPAGSFDAFVVRLTRQIELRWASSHVVIDGAYVPGRGPVGSRMHTTTHVMGLLAFDKQEDIRLIR